MVKVAIWIYFSLHVPIRLYSFVLGSPSWSEPKNWIFWSQRPLYLCHQVIEPVLHIGDAGYQPEHCPWWLWDHRFNSCASGFIIFSQMAPFRRVILPQRHLTVDIGPLRCRSYRLWSGVFRDTSGIKLNPEQPKRAVLCYWRKPRFTLTPVLAALK